MITIQNLTSTRIPKKKLEYLAKTILKKKWAGHNVSVVLVDPRRMRQLNRVYRGKDKPTNVLSFPGGKEALGEIVLCPSVIRKDALEYKISFQRAVSWMFVHGLLHLLGYDHKTSKDETTMNQQEQRYLSQIA